MVLVRKANDNKRKQTPVQNATSSHGNTNNYFNIAMPNTGMVGFTPNASRQSSSVYSPQQTPRRRHRNPSTSPVISNPDGNVQLDSYFEWLIKKFPAIKQKLLSAKEQLHERDIDLRTIQLLDHEQLGAWNITYGVADKIKREIKEFPGAPRVVEPVKHVVEEEEVEEDLYG
jgi:hypothetical protein